VEAEDKNKFEEEEKKAILLLNTDSYYVWLGHSIYQQYNDLGH